MQGFAQMDCWSRVPECSAPLPTYAHRPPSWPGGLDPPVIPGMTGGPITARRRDASPRSSPGMTRNAGASGDWFIVGRRLSQDWLTLQPRQSALGPTAPGVAVIEPEGYSSAIQSHRPSTRFTKTLEPRPCVRPRNSPPFHSIHIGRQTVAESDHSRVDEPSRHAVGSRDGAVHPVSRQSRGGGAA